MLQAIRERAGSVVVKVLFGVLVISFAIWGIGDIFRQGGAGETTLVEVGERKIQVAEVQQAFGEELERLRRTLRGAIDAAQAKALGLLDQTIERMITRQLFDLEAERLGLALGDEAVRQAIHANRAFQGPDGGFDRRIYSMSLANARLTEAQYEAELRGDMLRLQMSTALAGGATAPMLLADPLYRMRHEKRVADHVLVPFERAGDVGEPSEADLAELYERNRDRFRTPEYRGFTALVLTPETVAGEIEVAEDKLRAEYEARRAELEKPERREVRQILVESEEKAQAAVAALQEGKGFEEVAKEVAGQDPDLLSLGMVTRDELPPELGEPVFTLEPKKPGAPVRTAFGWHVVEVTAVEPGGIPAFEAVRDEIRRQLVQDEAANRLFEMANQIEDALAGGATVEEVAARFKLTPVTVAAADPDGRTPEGEEVTLPAAAAPEILATAFETPQGQASRVVESKDGGAFFLVQVNAVTPSSVKPQSEVAEQLRETWLAEKRSAAVESEAKALAAKVGDGKSLADIARENGLEVTTSEPFLRNAQGAGGLPATLVGALFQASPDAAVTAPGAGGWHIGQLKSVERPEPGADPAALDRLTRQLAANLRDDLVAQYQTGLRRRFPVEIHRQEIDRFF
jgi:peptidyl-prolyl cis-trans isomerase D